MKKLPKTVYVSIETDPNDKAASWLNAAATSNDIEHGQTVGIYELKETRVMKVSRHLSGR